MLNKGVAEAADKVEVGIGGGDEEHTDIDDTGAAGEQTYLHGRGVVKADDNERSVAEGVTNGTVGEKRVDGVGVEAGTIAEGSDLFFEAFEDGAQVVEFRIDIAESVGVFTGLDRAFAQVGEGGGDGLGDALDVGIEAAQIAIGVEAAKDVVEEEGVGAVGERMAGRVGSDLADGGGEIDGGEETQVGG